jgi:hypothetical protein
VTNASMMQDEKRIFGRQSTSTIIYLRTTTPLGPDYTLLEMKATFIM